MQIIKIHDIINKKYLSGMLQCLQFALLLAGSKGLETLNWNLSGKLLEHSLQENPQNITITESKYINKIIHNNNFKDKINKIIAGYGNEFYFDTGKEKESLAFECNSKDWNSIDLFLAIHNTTIQVIGKKKTNEKWDYKRLDRVNLKKDIKPLFIRYDKKLIEDEREKLRIDRSKIIS